MDDVSVTLSELKELMQRFSWERREWPRADVQREFGALVLYLMQQADRLGVDLVSAGEEHIMHRAASAPSAMSAGRGPVR
jgi:hypothetical protein